MAYLKVSEFLNRKDISAFLLGAFFSRYIFSDDKSLIYTNSTYKISKFVDYGAFEKSKSLYLEILNKKSKIGEWILKSKDTRIKNSLFAFGLENDLNLNQTQFFNRLYRKILESDFIDLDSENLNNNELDFIAAFFELRGSIDTNRALLAQDYFYNSNIEIKRARIFIDCFNISPSFLNFNFRELQKQYISGKNKRNTQLRISLPWYLKNIGLMNIYKAEIVKNVYDYRVLKTSNDLIIFDCQASESKTQTFESRMSFYANNIYDKKLNKIDTQNLRNDLEFDEITKTQEFKRNMSIVAVARRFLPDECVCCKDKYDIKDRSFKMRSNGRFYTEIHHIISLGKNKELDDPDNLVKICPTCHKALTPNRAQESYQKELISNILKNSNQAVEFAKMYFDLDNEIDLINAIYENLK